MSHRKHTRAGANKAAASPKRITLRVPAHAVARLEAFADACEIPMEDIWQEAREGLLGLLTDPSGCWMQPSEFARAWNFGTLDEAAEAARRLSLIDRRVPVTIRVGEGCVCYHDGKPLPVALDRFREPRAVMAAGSR